MKAAPAPPGRREYYAQSFADPAAQMLWDGGRLCCRTSGARADLLRLLCAEGVVRALGEDGFLAEAEPGGEPDGDSAFTLRLPHSYRLSYCYEWGAAMWKAGALHLISLMGVLTDLELTLERPQSYYLLFDGPRPIYVNPGSIAPLTLRTFRRAVELISGSLIYPLALARDGKSHLARRLLRGAGVGINPEDFPPLGELARAITAWLDQLAPADFLRALSREVEDMPIPDEGSEWSEYYGADAQPTPDSRWSSKQREVRRVLAELRPRTVTDLGCNAGWYARLAAQEGAEVVAADYDETCVNRLYSRALEGGEAVLPLVMDINDPSPAFGPGPGWLPSAAERLRSELVLALAISHHLVFSGMRLTLNQLVGAFAPFTKRWLLVEFVPFDGERMPYLRTDRPECADWYNLDSFVAALGERFSSVSVLPGQPGARNLVLCETQPD